MKNVPSAVPIVTTIPHRFPVLLFAVFATAPWIRWSNRFDIRTLVITTTLVAVVLGLVAWLWR